MSQVISRSNSEFLYQQVIQLVRDLCLQGSLLPGEKLPSLRKMADKLNKEPWDVICDLLIEEDLAGAGPVRFPP